MRTGPGLWIGGQCTLGLGPPGEMAWRAGRKPAHRPGGAPARGGAVMGMDAEQTLDESAPLGMAPKAASIQPYLSADNMYRKEAGCEGLARGLAVARTPKGCAGWRDQDRADQVTSSARARDARCGVDAGAGQRGGTSVVVGVDLRGAHLLTLGQLDTSSGTCAGGCRGADGVPGLGERQESPSAEVEARHLLVGWVQLRELLELRTSSRDEVWGRSTPGYSANRCTRQLLESLECLPAVGERFLAHRTRKGAATCALAVGVMLWKVRHLGGCAPIVPTAVPDRAIRSDFGQLSQQVTAVTAWERRAVILQAGAAGGTMTTKKAKGWAKVAWEQDLKPKVVEEEATAVAPATKSRKAEKALVASFLDDSDEDEFAEPS
ncbi:hypothetical protein CYMTET_4268 [Cymbomonas tetramitiformis]|uniref:Uncharacterized protein n=1 Tax=Cymbomonas tetramitiformis TaxID=36881 RepID=A0AAE0H1F5_9CHLO|nr:hypothetical protein CYMTET_4268 [Cymbomonas tetramitiformis]